MIISKGFINLINKEKISDITKKLIKTMRNDLNHHCPEVRIKTYSIDEWNKLMNKYTLFKVEKTKIKVKRLNK